MRGFKRIAVLAALAALVAPSVASADVTRDGSVFTATPSYCSCWSTIDGYQFVGIPYSPYVRDEFLKLPSDTPTAVEIWWKLEADPNYVPLPPVTSGSVTTTVSGTVGDDGSGGDDSDSGDAPIPF